MYLIFSLGRVVTNKAQSSIIVALVLLCKTVKCEHSQELLSLHVILFMDELSGKVRAFAITSHDGFVFSPLRVF